MPEPTLNIRPRTTGSIDLVVGGTHTAASTQFPWLVEDSQSAELCDQIVETFWRAPVGTELPKKQLAMSDTPLGPDRNEPGKGELRLTIPFGPATFSSGQKLSQQDVVAALNRPHDLQALGTASPVRGTDTVEFHLHDEYNARDVQQVFTQSFAAVALETGLGTGPYMLHARMSDAQIQAAERIVLVPNPHAATLGAYHSVIFQKYADEAALKRALVDGQVDFAPGLRPDLVRELGSNGLKGDTTSPASSTLILFFNTESPVMNVELRKAIRASIDPTGVTRTFGTFSLSHGAKSLIPKFMDPRPMPTWKTDAALAAEHMARSGAPRPLELVTLVPWAPRPYLPDPDGTFELIQKCVQPLGITLRKVQPKTHREYKELKSKDMHLVIGGWNADSPVKYQFYESHLASNMIPRPGAMNASANNQSRWDHRPTDAMLRKFKTDPSAANEDALNAVIDEHCILVPLAWGKIACLSGARIRNVKMTPLGRFYVNDIVPMTF